MDLRTATRAAGIVGGICWLTRYVLDAAGSGDGTAADILYWAGLALLLALTAAYGSGLVNKGALWLRAIVAIACPLLVWSVLEVLAPGIDPSFVDAVFGGGVLLLCVAGLVRGRGPGRQAKREPRRPHGAHAR